MRPKLLWLTCDWSLMFIPLKSFHSVIGLNKQSRRDETCYAVLKNNSVWVDQGRWVFDRHEAAAIAEKHQAAVTLLRELP